MTDAERIQELQAQLAAYHEALEYIKKIAANDGDCILAGIRHVTHIVLQSTAGASLLEELKALREIAGLAQKYAVSFANQKHNTIADYRNDMFKALAKLDAFRGKKSAIVIVSGKILMEIVAGQTLYAR